MSRVDKVILRFRDLITDTITKHNEIIAEKQYVWWGWWSKHGEKIPRDVFSELLKKAAQNKEGLEIYLYHSGKQILFSAVCEDIDYHKIDGEKKKTPDESSTPAYYSSREYLAWFKFSKIKELGKDEAIKKLNSYSYLEVADFFEDGRSMFESYYNKIVFSYDELKYQDRSIWFLRKARADDPAYEIRLNDPNSIKPEHFPRKFRVKTQNQFLWFSDLHFGKKHRFPIKREQEVSNKKTLLRVVNEFVEELNLNIGGVLISGDVSFGSEEDGFDSAVSFIENLMSSQTLTNYDFLICPGNHDFGFDYNLEEEGKPIPRQKDQSTYQYAKFYKKLFNLSPNEYFCCGRRFLLGNTYPVEVIALNTVTLQQTSGQFQGYGFVGDNQLRFVEKQYNWDKKKKDAPTRIAILHHHLIPITYTEETRAGSRYSLTLDSEAIVRWMLDHDVSVALHGHMHQPHFAQIRRPLDLPYLMKEPSSLGMKELSIISLGSSGVEVEYLGSLKENTIGVLTFEDRKLTIEIYEISPQISITSEEEPLLRVSLPIA